MDNAKMSSLRDKIDAQSAPTLVEKLVKKIKKVVKKAKKK